ncbi:hypothetical protein TIFTF001_020784 [Ficus carica]|uniref:Protein kinase domain-containing protein n=1 Tax=Ficus carica TaxID=3494 RepID=A0AA88AUD7_FICCA|nr:hypothetical protein TIFTF001_020784 [Ficus carica]
MEWTRGPAIGRGATATVHVATDIQSGELFAVKSAELSRSGFLRKEQSFLSKLSSSRIVRYLGFDVTTENDVPMYNLHMEYVPNGTLFDVIRGCGGSLDESLIKLYTLQILQGLDHLHEHGVAHCDVKSRNILIGEEGVKIADLGCSKLAGEVDMSEDSAVLKFSGTPIFMAPEVARGEKQGFEADIWALGCTVIEMATGRGPWPDMDDPVSALYRIGHSDHIPEFPRLFSEKGKDFLSKCLERNWRERWTVKELLGHPFLQVSESRSEQQEKAKTSSPISILDKDLWDSFEDSESHQEQEFEASSLNSAEERIKMLIRGTFSYVPNSPDWSCDEEDWFTVRSNSSEDSQDFTESESAHVEELSFIDDISTFDEELSFDNFVEIVSPFVSERSFVMELQNEMDIQIFLEWASNLSRGYMCERQKVLVEEFGGQ